MFLVEISGGFGRWAPIGLVMRPSLLLRIEAFLALLALIGVFYGLNHILPAYYAAASDARKVIFLSALGNPPLPLAWLTFVFLLIAPDLSGPGAVGDATGKRIWLYNLAHNYAFAWLVILPLGAMFSYFVAVETRLFGAIYLGLRLGLLWSIHIAVDRMLGYGLRTGWGRGDTHLSRSS